MESLAERSVKARNHGLRGEIKYKGFTMIIHRHWLQPKRVFWKKIESLDVPGMKVIGVEE